jgi:hypothetical protein
MNGRNSRGSSLLALTTATIASITLIATMYACDVDTATVASPGPFETAAARGGGPGAPGGGGGTAVVELAAGVTTAGQQQVIIVTDNNRRLTLDTPSEESEMYASAYNLSLTHAAGLANCVLRGAFDGVLAPEDLLDVMIEASAFRDFTLYIDKDDAADGTVSDYHQLKQDWAISSPTGKIVTFIGFKNKKARIPGVSDPVVTATDHGGGTTSYTFQGGTGIVAIDELHESVGILCALLDDVEVKVTISP